MTARCQAVKPRTLGHINDNMSLHLILTGWLTSHDRLLQLLVVQQRGQHRRHVDN